jgi:putative ABC transport system permease protein
MLEHWFPNEIARGVAECIIAGLLALAVILLLRRRAPNLLSQVFIAELRGLFQIVAVGAILSALLHGPQWTAILVLAGMVIAAASIVRKRAVRIPRAYSLALIAIAAGPGIVLALMIALGVVPLHIAILVPVGSMVIANAMNTQSMFLNRFQGEVLAHTGQIESALALGVSSDLAVKPYLEAALRASLIPSIDNLRSLGIVWIPGLMAGIVLSGKSPLYGSLYQFVVLAIILSAAGLSCYATTFLVTKRIFSSHEQLLLRGE